MIHNFLTLRTQRFQGSHIGRQTSIQRRAGQFLKLRLERIERLERRLEIIDGPTDRRFGP